MMSHCGSPSASLRAVGLNGVGETERRTANGWDMVVSCRPLLSQNADVPQWFISPSLFSFLTPPPPSPPSFPLTPPQNHVPTTHDNSRQRAPAQLQHGLQIAHSGDLQLCPLCRAMRDRNGRYMRGRRGRPRGGGGREEITMVLDRVQGKATRTRSLCVEMQFSDRRCVRWCLEGAFGEKTWVF